MEETEFNELTVENLNSIFEKDPKRWKNAYEKLRKDNDLKRDEFLKRLNEEIEQNEKS